MIAHRSILNAEPPMDSYIMGRGKSLSSISA